MRTDGPLRDGGGPRRTLEFEGCVNFRDLGGYATTDGHTTAWRRLFRADGLHRLTTVDRAQLIDLGLATVIDLRTVDESSERGRFPVEDVPVRYTALPVLDVLPAPNEMPSWRESSYVAARYMEMVSNGAGSLTGALDVLAAPGALPAVFHCSAGKDRTGVLSALVLAFLGVPDETIVADYALSGEAMGHLLERLKAEYPDNVEEVERYAPAMLEVKAEAMDEFLDLVRSHYGGYDGLADRLGVTDAVGRLRGTLLVEA